MYYAISCLQRNADDSESNAAVYEREGNFAQANYLKEHVAHHRAAILILQAHIDKMEADALITAQATMQTAAKK